MKKVLLCLLCIILLVSCGKKNEEAEKPLLVLRYGDNQPDYYPPPVPPDISAKR